VDPILSGTDPLKLNHDDEAKLGQAVHDLIRQHHQLRDNPVFRNRLYRLAGPFRDQRARKDVDIKIFLLDSDQPVAFSHVGGYIYLSRCLEHLIPNDVELEFLIAHEIAHVDQRHGLQQVAKTMAGKPSIPPDLPGLVQRIYHQIAAARDSDQERAADEWAAGQLLRLGRTRHQILAFLRRLETYGAREDEEPNKPHKPGAVLEGEVQDIEAHLQRHPPIPFRLRDLEKVLDARPSAQ
jgi:predicted Zn-dependent protease